ncbi:MmcQ/YjbR family DNA-binding protein [Nocardioides marmoraquaticus]
MSCAVVDVLDLAHQLEQVVVAEGDRWSDLRVAGRTFGYVWPATVTVGLKQLLVEQRALVAERPEVFEVQFTAGRFGWVVCHLERIERDELAELVFEAWRLSAPDDLVDTRADRLPV